MDRHPPAPKPLKHTRYANQVMFDTVCIAATCIDTGTRRVFGILCSDGRIEIEGVASGEIGHKAVAIAPGMSAMFAGSVSKSRELIDRYMAYLNGPNVTREPGNILELLREPLELQHRADVTAFLSARFGMTYDEFVERDATSQQTLLSGFEYWNHRSELIIMWLGHQFARLFSVTDRIEECASFAVVGCGSQAAAASLHARGYRTMHFLREALYYVYEAKRFSESIPGVGKMTHVTILEFDQGSGENAAHPLHQRELDALASQYENIGKLRPFTVLEARQMAVNLRFIPGMN